jgi:hypothetical protein
VRRFDASRAELNAFGYYIVPVKSICATRSYKCLRCPLRDPHKRINSCTYMFRKIIGEDLISRLHMHDSGILWEQERDGDAREALSRVSSFLNAAEKYDRRKSAKKSPPR